MSYDPREKTYWDYLREKGGDMTDSDHHYQYAPTMEKLVYAHSRLLSASYGGLDPVGASDMAETIAEAISLMRDMKSSLDMAI